MTIKDDWSNEQRRLLVECAYHTTVVTGHDIQDCLMELQKLVREFKDGKLDDHGRKNDNEQDEPAEAVR